MIWSGYGKFTFFHMDYWRVLYYLLWLGLHINYDTEVNSKLGYDSCIKALIIFVRSVFTFWWELLIDGSDIINKVRDKSLSLNNHLNLRPMMNGMVVELKWNVF